MAAALCALTGVAAAPDAVGLNAHVPTNDELDALADLGVGWVRVDGNWFTLEPAEGRYAWADMDRVVDGARARGLQVYMTLAYGPQWATEPDGDEYPHNGVPRAGTYGRFVAAAVAHYRGRVAHFGLWNEPNLRQFWGGNLDQYLDRVVRPGAAAVREACPDCRVLGPDIAAVSDWQDDLEYILRGAGDAFDIVAHHTYAGVRGTRGGAQWLCDDFQHAIDIGDDAICFYKPGVRQVLDRVDWQGPMWQSSSAVSRVLRRRSGLDRVDWQGPMWLTETGYRTQPWDSDGEQEKQRLTVERTLALQRATPWWTHTFFYELSDCGVLQPGCPIDGYGITRRVSGPDGTWQDNFRLKPAYTWLRQTLQDPEWRGMAPPPEEPPPPPPPEAVLEAPRLRGATLDGRLDEWDDQGCAPLDRWEPVAEATRPGAADLAARACAAWTDDALWLAVEVADDTHTNDRPEDLLWQGDSVQLAVDLDADGGDAGYDEDDAEWTVGLVGAETRIRAEHGARGAQAVVRRAAGRTAYELRVPLPGLVAGRDLRASFLVNEADEGDREGWLEWTPGIGRAKQPGRFGVVTLGATSAEPPDGGPPAEEPDARPPPPVPGPDAGFAADAADPGTPADGAVATDGAMPVNDASAREGAAGADGGLLAADPLGTPVTQPGEGCQGAPGAPLGWLWALLLVLALPRDRRADLRGE
ncbi:MAG: beta-galactosidase [Myxococcales bacterium]|nr:beta-galactosidase [Myxococcales bacterium]